MTTLLGTVFSTDEKTIAQADLKLLGSTIKSILIEFNQEKFEELLPRASLAQGNAAVLQNLFGDSL